MAGGAVWFDFENTPHVLFLEPLLRSVQAAGWNTVATAKPQSQTLELANARGLSFDAVGEGNVKGRVQKVFFGLSRAAKLAAWAIQRGRPRLLVSSSRSACVAARWLGIPAVGLLDYEHSEHRPFSMSCRPVLLPDLLSEADLDPDLRRAAQFFEGLKENLYIDSRGLDRQEARAAIGISNGSYVVVARPPASNAHYADRVEESTALWLRIVRELQAGEDSKIYLLPRDQEQCEWLYELFDGTPRVHLFPTVLDGPALVAAADLVVSGGGTMNREAAALGVPAWSVFTGATPHIDKCLEREGRLRWIRNDAEFEAAQAAPAPALSPRRGPYPLGFNMIMEAITAHLNLPERKRMRKPVESPVEVFD